MLIMIPSVWQRSIRNILTRTLAVSLPISLLLFTCIHKQSEKHKVDFYYWKSNFTLSAKEEALLNASKTEKLYVKYFDIKLEQGTGTIHPVATLTGLFKDTKQQIIPCVFIENQVFYKLDSSKISVFAKTVFKKIKRQDSILHNPHVLELHIDCDWTKTTKESYFKFLSELEKISGLTASSTIRLHQIKYTHITGIPPVKKAVLMCYNMGKVQDFDEQNSIFSLDVLKDYTKNISSYPVALDIALPIYEWTVVFRNKKIAFIINENKLLDNNKNIIPLYGNRFTCIASTHIGDKILQKGDVLRNEKLLKSDLKQAIGYFDDKLNHYNIILYHLNQSNITNHESFIQDIIF